MINDTVQFIIYTASFTERTGNRLHRTETSRGGWAGGRGGGSATLCPGPPAPGPKRHTCGAPGDARGVSVTFGTQPRTVSLEFVRRTNAEAELRAGSTPPTLGDLWFCSHGGVYSQRQIRLILLQLEIMQI